MKIEISPKELYSAAAAMLKNETPLKINCGRLCKNACCAVTEEITGMYLFPREEEMYRPVPLWGRIYGTDFEYKNGRLAKLFTCGGKCDRNRRPLACMIFPLVPYARRGEKMKIIMDPRGRGMCPLARAMSINDLEPSFVKAVHRSMKLLTANSECMEFIYSLSEILDEEKF